MNHPEFKLFLFSSYAYVQRLLYLLINFLPYFITCYIYRLLFKKMGHTVLIDYQGEFRYPHKISIGNKVSINKGCKFFCSFMSDQGSIEIGNNVAIAPEVVVFAASHDYHSLDLPDRASRVVIEDDVWIGGRAVILPGVTIGRGSVIGAGAVVVNDIPPYSIAVGNPARVIKQRELTVKDGTN